MLFNSLPFFLVFFAIFVTHVYLPQRLRNLFLLFCSYGIYATFDPRFLLLLATSTLVDYFCARNIDRCRDESPAKAKAFLLVSILVNLGILGLFKYHGFFLDNLSRLSALFGFDLTLLRLELVLPVGISFYTFQTMSYSIDVYRGRSRVCSDFIDFALFVAYFPQLLAGPIERSRRLLPQIQSEREVDVDDIKRGSTLILWGLFKKVYIADNLAIYVKWGILEQGAATGPEFYLVMLAFAFQIYCDFSGYSDMARGFSAWLGIRLSINFNLPYFASHPKAFWQHWHITLSAWFRDYVYAPIKNFTSSPAMATLLTMILVGFWHGPRWTFIVWGAYWGAILLIQDRVMQGAPSTTLGKICGTVLTFHLWMLSGCFFLATDMTQTLWCFEVLTKWGMSERLLKDAILMLFLVWPLLWVQGVQVMRGALEFESCMSKVTRRLFCSILVILLMINGSWSEKSFIYFHF